VVTLRKIKIIRILHPLAGDAMIVEEISMEKMVGRLSEPPKA
jgi:hypothetical protein